MKDATLIDLGAVSEETMGAPELPDSCENILDPVGSGRILPKELCSV